MTPAPESEEIFIAGTVHAPSSKTARAASGVEVPPFYGEQSQYAAEFYAALEAIRMTGSETVLTITSTQSYVQAAMNKKLPGWEHEGWDVRASANDACQLRAQSTLALSRQYEGSGQYTRQF
ncbi:hypothetical protein DFH07DRAFT_782839 [Mycena maculata]|uniref:RNase H type-1 domain-containing protein n=1 Tax=Mycena maculata TaxID=230809 RepID=A0AAD7HS86_9AGAR|nr:hypothetical protein DFH07DRAFT_782839 [Mycena maculata]